ncbi:MBL fold metallo-hydrolase [Bradyrhizobium sp. CB1650]|uniref:MBL fold metallo-hydrolase n=1 Tax=Bradyrhizobium sp. CB1650 TaxID=3039153 RepID=UPI002434E4A6|nr:MBL fold metallo-hydrolase [Bradyrhizobium sp. CB1650]WGD53170.1 MBL fold metallo-hydrolase [Bradyrhizobium sp. CB1650]
MSADTKKPALTTEVFVGPQATMEGGKGTFSPTSSTLICGEHDAVLVDAQHLRADILALGDLVERQGRRLTTIYITHGHADHYYGITELLRRFPTARAVATKAVVAYIRENEKNQEKQWRQMFGDRVAIPADIPEVISDKLSLEGHALEIYELGQADITPSTALHVPSIGLIVPGDLVYNGIHMMLGLGGPKQWGEWYRNVEALERLAPAMIVAGHKKPDASDCEVARIFAETKSYIRDFESAAARAKSAPELVEAMTAKYPDFGNPWTLRFSARSRFPRSV